MSITLVVPQVMASEIEQIAQLPRETAGVMFVSVVEAPGGNVRLLARKMRWIPDNDYLRREWNGLTIPASGYVPFLGEAESAGATCVWVHTHPGLEARPTPSAHDHRVDDELAPVFRLRVNTPYYGALIFSYGRDGLVYSGHLDGEDRPSAPIDRLWRIGDRFRLLHAYGSRTPELAPTYDRNIRAFGPAIQGALGDLRVGIVGCGGTGSIIAEQLVRLGVKRVLLVDPDRLSESNLTRVYGSTVADVDRPKVEILAEHLSRIAVGVRCETVQAMVSVEPTARQLVGCDVVFGCTDDNAGRLVLSRFATYLMTPVIDCGVLLSSGEHGELIGIDGRVTVLSPGQACLVCRGRIDLGRAASELMTPQERQRRQDEGYAPALGGVEPAVVSFTTMVGAAAVNELLERLVGFGPPTRPSEVLLRCHDREISTNRAYPAPGHYCDPARGKMGAGCVTPFLEQTWPE